MPYSFSSWKIPILFIERKRNWCETKNHTFQMKSTAAKAATRKKLMKMKVDRFSNAVYNAHIFIHIHTCFVAHSKARFSLSLPFCLLFYSIWFCLRLRRSFPFSIDDAPCFLTFNCSFVCLFVYTFRERKKNVTKWKRQMKCVRLKTEECFVLFVKVQFILHKKRCFWNWWMWMNT